MSHSEFIWKACLSIRAKQCHLEFISRSLWKYKSCSLIQNVYSGQNSDTNSLGEAKRDGGTWRIASPCSARFRLQVSFANFHFFLICALSSSLLTPFGWLRPTTLTLYCWWEHFDMSLFMPTFPGTRLGRKTRAGRIFEWRQNVFFLFPNDIFTYWKHVHLHTHTHTKTRCFKM